jgi:hypothetical protein
MSNNLLPSKRIFNAVFDELVYYVENDCAEKELVYGTGNYSWWEKFIFNYFPRKYSIDLRRRLGLGYINNILNLELEEYMYIKETYKRVKELYHWYIGEYPFIKNPWLEPAPNIRFVDEFGKEVPSLFGDGKLNKLHPDYINYLSKCGDIEREQKNLLENKLQELLKIRFVL